jgi:hypothetical protein
MLKLIHLALGGRPPTIRERLLGGEPILFAVAFVLSVPVPLWMSWQLHRGYTHGFQLASDCYGRFAAVSALPGTKTKIDPLRLYQAADSAESLAKRAGELLGFRRDVVTAALSNKTHLYTRRYAALTRAGAPRKAFEQEAEVRHCFKTLQDIELSPPWL